MKVVITTKSSKGYTKIGILVSCTVKSHVPVAVIKYLTPLHDGTKYAYISQGGYAPL